MRGRFRILAYDGQGFWLATKRLSKGRFHWWPTGAEASRSLRAHQAQLLLAGGNPDIEAAPVWRRVERMKNNRRRSRAFRFPFCHSDERWQRWKWRYRGRVITAQELEFVPNSSNNIRA